MEKANEATSNGTPVQGRSMRKAAAASLAATSIEWYDFFIFGTAAALVFPQLFFPEATPAIGILLSFSTFGVGFLARPVGGALFGQLGDKIGRKKTLIITLMLMGVSSVLIGVLPTYGTIGVLAPLLLTVLRLAQGLAIGGQWGGAMLLVTESAPRDRRGFYGSFAQLGIPIGLVIANVLFLIIAATLPDAAFASWGWRVPFLLSVVLIGIALYISLRLEDTVAFERVKESHTEARLPIFDVFRTYPKQIALAAGATVAPSGTYFVMTTYIISYGTETLGVSNSAMLLGVLLSSVLSIPVLIFFAWLSDRTGRRVIYMAGATFMGLWSFVAFFLIDTGTVALIWIALAVYQVGFGMTYGPQPALFAEMFGTRVRYSGASLGYQLGGALGGGFAPIIASALFAATGASLAISAYMAAICVITLLCAFLITETFQKNLDEDENEEQELIAEANRPSSAG